MKKGIHPKLVESTVTCACGNSFTTMSVKPQLKVEVCSNCHPFYTGTMRILDTGGQVERFMRRLGKAGAGAPVGKVPGAPEEPAEEKTAEG
jgi:large subunit ribosomal protein L31